MAPSTHRPDISPEPQRRSHKRSRISLRKPSPLPESAMQAATIAGAASFLSLPRSPSTPKKKASHEVLLPNGLPPEEATPRPSLRSGASTVVGSRKRSSTADSLALKRSSSGPSSVHVPSASDSSPRPLPAIPTSEQPQKSARLSQTQHTPSPSEGSPVLQTVSSPTSALPRERAPAKLFRNFGGSSHNVDGDLIRNSSGSTLNRRDSGKSFAFRKKIGLISPPTNVVHLGGAKDVPSIADNRGLPTVSSRAPRPPPIMVPPRHFPGHLTMQESYFSATSEWQREQAANMLQEGTAAQTKPSVKQGIQQSRSSGMVPALSKLQSNIKQAFQVGHARLHSRSRSSTSDLRASASLPAYSAHSLGSGSVERPLSPTAEECIGMERPSSALAAVTTSAPSKPVLRGSRARRSSTANGLGSTGISKSQEQLRTSPQLISTATSMATARPSSSPGLCNPPVATLCRFSSSETDVSAAATLAKLAGASAQAQRGKSARKTARSLRLLRSEADSGPQAEDKHQSVSASQTSTPQPVEPSQSRLGMPLSLRRSNSIGGIFQSNGKADNSPYEEMLNVSLPTLPPMRASRQSNTRKDVLRQRARAGSSSIGSATSVPASSSAPYHAQGGASSLQSFSASPKSLVSLSSATSSELDSPHSSFYNHASSLQPYQTTQGTYSLEDQLAASKARSSIDSIRHGNHLGLQVSASLLDVTTAALPHTEESNGSSSRPGTFILSSPSLVDSPVLVPTVNSLRHRKKYAFTIVTPQGVSTDYDDAFELDSIHERDEAPADERVLRKQLSLDDLDRISLELQLHDLDNGFDIESFRDGRSRLNLRYTAKVSMSDNGSAFRILQGTTSVGRQQKRNYLAPQDILRRVRDQQSRSCLSSPTSRVSAASVDPPLCSWGPHERAASQPNPSGRSTTPLSFLPRPLLLPTFAEQEWLSSEESLKPSPVTPSARRKSEGIASGTSSSRQYSSTAIESWGPSKYR